MQGALVAVLEQPKKLCLDRSAAHRMRLTSHFGQLSLLPAPAHRRDDGMEVWQLGNCLELVAVEWSVRPLVWVGTVCQAYTMVCSWDWTACPWGLTVACELAFSSRWGRGRLDSELEYNLADSVFNTHWQRSLSCLLLEEAQKPEMTVEQVQRRDEKE